MLGARRALRRGIALGKGGGAVFIPPGLGWTGASFAVGPSINDPGGMTRAVGDAGVTPETMFDRFSDVRTNPELTYYVGPGGSDSNSGLSYALRLVTIGVAITKANMAAKKARVFVDAGEYNRTFGPQGVVPLYDIAIIAVGGRVTTGLFDTFGAFALDGTYTNCYSLTVGGIDRLVNRLSQDAYGDLVDYRLYASATLLNAATLTEDSYAYEGGKVYCRRLDAAIPTPTNTRLFRTAVHLFIMTTAINAYFEGIDAEGGNVGSFDYRMGSISGTQKAVVFKNCTSKFAGGNGNTNARGFSIDGINGIGYLFGCSARRAATDGINAHDAVGAGTRLLTVNCDGINNGRGTNQSCNGLTLHEGVLGIDLGGHYEFNRGGTVRNTNTSKALLAGARIANDLGDVSQGGSTPPVALQPEISAQVWADRCKIDMPSGQIAVNASGSSIYLARNVTVSPGALVQGGGTIGTY